MYRCFKYLMQMLFLISKMFSNAIMIMVLCCAGSVIETKAEEIQKTIFSGSTFSFRETVGEKNARMFEFNNPGYKSGKKGSVSNKRFAPAYRLRELPHLAVKTNALFDLTTSMNLGFEARLWRKITLDMPFTLNPWTYNKTKNSKFKFFLTQPELRYWTCEAFDGHFFGLHGHYTYYNVGRLPNPPFSETMHQYRFEGQLAGGGISYGYVWPINPRWSFEAEIGFGYSLLWYDKYPCQNCSKMINSEKKRYWGLTRAGLNLIYYIF